MTAGELAVLLAAVLCCIGFAALVVVLMRVLDTFGIRRNRDWVRTQLRQLDQLGAVRVTEAGTVMVAALTKLGRDHPARRNSTAVGRTAHVHRFGACRGR